MEACRAGNNNDCVGKNIDTSLPQALQRWQAGETTTMSEYSSVMDDDNSRHYHSSSYYTYYGGKLYQLQWSMMLNSYNC
ncbi:hypothetical protein SOVF_068760 [Spinacia oleracea]|nr:hypothetical protein SOVF_068760 [Spinacia oleracea]